MSKESEYPQNFYFKKRRFEPLLILSVVHIVVGIWGIIICALAYFNLNEIGYSQFVLNFAFICLGVIFAREYYFKMNRKFPDLQIEEDGFSIRTNFKQNKKVQFWWSSMDSLGKKEYKKKIWASFIQSIIR